MDVPRGPAPGPPVVPPRLERVPERPAPPPRPDRLQPPSVQWASERNTPEDRLPDRRGSVKFGRQRVRSRSGGLSRNTEDGGRSGDAESDAAADEVLDSVTKAKSDEYIPRGSVYVYGFYAIEYKMQIQSYLDVCKSKSSMKSKGLLDFWKSSSNHLSVPETYLFSRIQDLSDECEHIAVGENTMAVIDGEELYMSGSKVLPIKCIGHRNVEGNVKTDFDKFLLVKSVRNACEVSWYACWVVGSEDRYANKSIPSLYDFQWAVPFRLLDMDQPSVGFGYNVTMKKEQNVQSSKSSKKDKGSMSSQQVLAMMQSQFGSVFDVGHTGLLGQGKSAPVLNPQPIIIKGCRGEILSVTCGSGVTAVVTSHGLYTFGMPRMLARDGDPTVPMLVTSIKGHVMKVSCGLAHVVALTSDGNVWTWGDNILGQLGTASHKLASQTPKQVMSLRNVEDIACGHRHSLALNAKGCVFSWGMNAFGELGLGKPKSVPLARLHQESDTWFIEAPQDVMKLPERVQTIGCGPNNSIAVTCTGVVYIWGKFSGPTMALEQTTPLRFAPAFDERVFITDAKIGLTHALFLEDSKKTQLIELLIKVHKKEIENEIKFVTSMMDMIPERELPFVQWRALAHIQEATGATIPTVNISDYVTRFYPRRKANRLSHGICFENPTDKKLTVSVDISRTIIPDSLKATYRISVDPVKFTLEKKKKVEVLFTLVCDKSPKDDFHAYLPITSWEEKGEKDKGTSSTAITQYVKVVAKTRVVTRQAEGARDSACKLVQDMGSYVPNFILKDLKVNPDPPYRPLIDKFDAVILFIDVSGFTALNERLAKLGPAGPEQVSKHLNAYFGQLIDAVNAHGGDVLKFAGDALICMFGDNSKASEPLMIQSLRAIQCALEVQTDLAGYDSNQGFTLTLHVGIGVGKMFSLYVGGVDDSWEFLVVGEPFLQLKTSVDASKTGEVVVSQECWDLVSSRCTGEPRGSDWLVTEVYDSVVTKPIDKHVPTPAMENALRCYIQKGVQMRLESRQSDWLAELRRVTVLFIKLDSISYDKNKEFDLLSVQKVLKFMQSVIFRYEGMVRQFLVDDKGTVLIAAFGVPPMSHEDDTIRGLKTALEVHETLNERNMVNSIGITTGNVFCGSVGSALRQEYAMVGDIVNLAARLMVAAGKAKVGLLCDDPTYESSVQKIDFRVLEPIMVKGKSKPIKIFRPSLKDETAEALAPVEAATDDERVTEKLKVVGRNNLIHMLQQGLDAVAQEKKGSVTVLEGEPGVGKTIVLDHVCDMLYDLKGGYFRYFVQVLQGKCDAVERNTPFYSWRHIIIQLLYLDQSLGADRAPLHNVVPNVKKDIGDEMQKYIPLLNEILPVLKLEENEITSNFAPAQRKLHARHLISHLLARRSAKRPLVILLDDFQWIDAASMQLTYDLARESSQICLIISTRPFPPPIPSEYRNLVTMPRTEHVELSSLEKNMNQIINVKFKTWNMPKNMEDFINTSGGNPKMAIELIRAMLDSEFVSINNGAFTAHPEFDQKVRHMPVPKVVASMIASRMDRLSATQQMILKVASVIGERFRKRDLEAVYPIKEEVVAVKACSRELCKMSYFSKIEKKDNGSIYTFVNDIVQRVAYSRLLFGQRRQLHFKIAEYLERKGAPLEDVLAHYAAAYEGSGVSTGELSVLRKLVGARFRSYYKKLSRDDLEGAEEEKKSILKLVEASESEAEKKGNGGANEVKALAEQVRQGFPSLPWSSKKDQQLPEKRPSSGPCPRDRGVSFRVPSQTLSPSPSA